MDWTELIMELVELVESTAPAVWEIARRQVVANIVEMTLWAVALTVLLIVSLKLGKTWRVKIEECPSSEEDLYGWGIALAYTAAVIAVPIIFSLVVSIAKRFVNVDYYALRLILDWVR